MESGSLWLMSPDRRSKKRGSAGKEHGKAYEIRSYVRRSAWAEFWNRTGFESLTEVKSGSTVASDFFNGLRRLAGADRGQRSRS